MEAMWGIFLKIRSSIKLNDATILYNGVCRRNEGDLYSLVLFAGV
jgi:hypothetical protein